MNKDNRNLSVEEQNYLVLSPKQLLIEYSSRIQLHFNPDPVYSSEIDRISCLVKCCVCQKVPLDIKQCVMCEAVVCKECKYQIQYTNE